MTLREQLSRPMHADEARQLGATADRMALFELLSDADKRTADNAAWVLTLLSARRRRLFQLLQPELIDLAMGTSSTTQRRLLLTLLSHQRFDTHATRADFIDFCLAQLSAAEAPTAVRSAAMKLAYKQCLPYPELRSELRATLELLPEELLSAGLRSARRNVLRRL